LWRKAWFDRRKPASLEDEKADAAAQRHRLKNEEEFVRKGKRR